CRMAQRGTHQAPQQAERLGLPIGERGYFGGDDLEHSEDPRLVLERNHQEGSDAYIAVSSVLDARVAIGVIAPLQLPGPDAKSGETRVDLERGRFGPDMHLRNQLIAYDRLDHGATRSSQRHAALRDRPHD